jgi:hypothetical protein
MGLDPVTAVLVAIAFASWLAYVGWQRSEGWIETAKEWAPSRVKERAAASARAGNSRVGTEFDRWAKNAQGTPWHALATALRGCVRFGRWAKRLNDKKQGRAHDEKGNSDDGAGKRGRKGRSDKQDRSNKKGERDGRDNTDGDSRESSTSDPDPKTSGSPDTTEPEPKPSGGADHAGTPDPEPTSTPEPQPAAEPATSTGGVMAPVSRPPVGEITGLSGMLRALKRILADIGTNALHVESHRKEARALAVSGEQVAAAITGILQHLEAVELACHTGELEPKALAAVTDAATALTTARVRQRAAFSAQAQAHLATQQAYQAMKAAEAAAAAAVTQIRKHVPVADAEIASATQAAAGWRKQ